MEHDVSFEFKTWADWKGAGFFKLKHFWDRDLYVKTSSTSANVQALNDDAASVPGQQLGLAEFSNGNFLGVNALYGELYAPGGSLSSSLAHQLHFFPFPSLLTSTPYPVAVIRTVTLRDGTVVQQPYLDKMDGFPVQSHARLTYHSVLFGSTLTITLRQPLMTMKFSALLIQF